MATQSQISCLDIIENKDNYGLVRLVSKLTPLDGIKSPNQLSIIKKQKGEEYALEQIIYLIKWINEAYTKGLSDSIVFEVSLSILNDYYGFKIEDIALFASEFRKGNLVKVPYHLEMHHIYEGLKEYDRRRNKANDQRHEDIKQNGDMPRQPELTEAQKLGGMIKHISKNIE